MKKLYRVVAAVALGLLIVLALQKDLDRSEEMEKTRLREFFTELDRVYGFLYTAENGSYRLFLKIEENTHHGELAGYLLLMTNTENKGTYEETKYELNGITDGLMVLFFTDVDGKQTKLEGNFRGSASELDLLFWTTDQILRFFAVTENEFKQSDKAFK